MQKDNVHEEKWELEPQEHTAEDTVAPSRKSGVLNVVISGLALFSDGYNAQISTCPPSFPSL